MSNTNVLVIFNEFLLPKTVVPSIVNISTDTSNIFITRDSYITTILNSTGGLPLVATNIGPALGLRGLVGGSFINLVSTDSTVSINTSNVLLTSLGGVTLVGTSVGPALSVRGLVAGSGMTIGSTNTTLLVSAPPQLDYGKFVITNPGVGINFTSTLTEMQIVWKKNAADSTSTINNSPVNYRVYNNTGSTRIFQVDADIFITGVSNTTLHSVGLFAQGESTAGTNFLYSQDGVSTYSLMFHIVRNITLTNGQYVSLYCQAGTTSSPTLSVGCSITMNTID